MADEVKYNNCPTDEDRRIVDDYMARDDERGTLLRDAILSYHSMASALDTRSRQRDEQGQSLIKYDPFKGQGRILRQLARRDAVSQATLARDLAVKPQTLSTAIKKLEAKGLVRRQTDPLDARSQLVYITSAGLELEKGYEQSDKYSGSMFEALDDDELRHMIVMLGKLKAHLEEEIQAAKAIKDLLA